MRTQIPLLAALVLVGCARTPELPGVDAIRPELTFERLEVTGLDFDQVEANLVFALQNPYPVTIEMNRLTWNLELAEAQILTGDGPGATLPSDTEARLAVPVTLRWREVAPALNAIGSRDDMPWTLTGTAAFDTPIGDVQLPYEAAGTLPALHPPRLSFEAIGLRELDLRNGLASVDLVLAVDPDAELEVERLDYTLQIEGTKVAESITGVTRRDDALVLTAELDLHQLGEAVLDTFATGGAVDVRLQGTADVETPHGTVPLELDLDDLVYIEDRGRL